MGPEAKAGNGEAEKVRITIPTTIGVHPSQLEGNTEGIPMFEVTDGEEFLSDYERGLVVEVARIFNTEIDSPLIIHAEPRPSLDN